MLDLRDHIQTVVSAVGKNKTMRIRPYQSSDAREIADLYHNAVHAIDGAYYSREQVEAWAPTPPDYVHWQRRLDQKQPDTVGEL